MTVETAHSSETGDRTKFLSSVSRYQLFQQAGAEKLFSYDLDDAVQSIFQF